MQRIFIPPSTDPVARDLQLRVATVILSFAHGSPDHTLMQALRDRPLSLVQLVHRDMANRYTLQFDNRLVAHCDFGPLLQQLSAATTDLKMTQLRTSNCWRLEMAGRVPYAPPLVSMLVCILVVFCLMFAVLWWELNSTEYRLH